MMDTPVEPVVNEAYLDDLPKAEKPPVKRNLFFTPFGIVVILTAALMIAVVAWGVYQNSLTQLTDGPAPDFNLPLLGQEGNFKLSDHRGHVVVINFWGSWCPPCREEAPMLQRTYEFYQDRGVVFVGMDVKDIESDALAYIDEFNITYPNVKDIGGRMEDAYRTTGVPETFIVNKEGEITKFFYAKPPEEDLRAAIEAALNS